GRVIGGRAQVIGSSRQPALASETFAVGTRFRVERDPLQVGLIGKITANFAPETEISWTRADPSVVELELHSGLAAFRYDRKESDPILRIRTPTAIVRVVGTVFTVDVKAKDT